MPFITPPWSAESRHVSSVQFYSKLHLLIYFRAQVTSAPPLPVMSNELSRAKPKPETALAGVIDVISQLIPLQGVKD